MEPDEHRYRLAWWIPASWVVGGTVVGTVGGQPFLGALAAALVLTLLLTGTSRLGAWELVTSPRGVRHRRREARWSQLRLVRGRWRTVLRTSGLPLKESIVVAPRTYAWHWERSRLGDDLRRWAPHLLDPSVPSGPGPAPNDDQEPR